jgi:hypothetical protein
MEKNNKADAYVKKLITLLAKKIDINTDKHDMDELVKGMFVELEHGSKNQTTNITDDDPMNTFKIVLAHVDELPDYYTRLEEMENEVNSVRTKILKKDSKEEASKEKNKKDLTMESVSKRFQELCGIVEGSQKKQLKNEVYQEKIKKTILKEDIDPEKFKIVKFSNDGLGKKQSQEEIDLYKMQEPSDGESKN